MFSTRILVGLQEIFIPRLCSQEENYSLQHVSLNLPRNEEVTTKRSSSKGVYVVASSTGLSRNNGTKYLVKLREDIIFN
jgi:hypothetical protein